MKPTKCVNCRQPLEEIRTTEEFGGILLPLVDYTHAGGEMLCNLPTTKGRVPYTAQPPPPPQHP